MKACRSCSAPCDDAASFCNQCGTRFEAPSTLSCPRGHGLMKLVRYSTIDLDECPSCRGTWYDKDEMEQALEERKAESIGEEIPRTVQKATVTETQVQYLKCPRCGTMMNRVNFEKVSGVIIDCCRACGVWLDGGEFEKIYAFVSSGGGAPPDQLPPPPAVVDRSYAGGPSGWNGFWVSMAIDVLFSMVFRRRW